MSGLNISQRLPYLDRDFARQVDRLLVSWKRENGVTEDLYALGFRPASFLFRGALRELARHPEREDKAGDVLNNLVFFRIYSTADGPGSFFNMIADRLTRDERLDSVEPEWAMNWLNKFLFGNARRAARNEWRAVNRDKRNVYIDAYREGHGDAIDLAMTESVHRPTTDDVLNAFYSFSDGGRFLYTALDVLVTREGTLQGRIKDRLKDFLLNPYSSINNLQGVAIAVLSDEIAQGAPFDLDEALREKRTLKTREWGPSARRLNTLKVTLSQLIKKAEKLGPVLLERAGKDTSGVFHGKARELERAFEVIRAF